MTLLSVRRLAWLALLAAMMHVLLPAAHAMAGGGMAGTRGASPRVLAAYCLSPGSPLESLFRGMADTKARPASDAVPDGSASAAPVALSPAALSASGAPIATADMALADPDPWIIASSHPAPSPDTTFATCPLCLAAAMAAVLAAPPELTQTGRALLRVLAPQAANVPAPGIVLLSFLSRGPPAQG